MKVKVLVENLCTDLSGKEVTHRKGETFEVTAEEARKLGSSVVVLEKDTVTSQDLVTPDSSKKTQKSRKRK